MSVPTTGPAGGTAARDVAGEVSKSGERAPSAPVDPVPDGPLGQQTAQQAILPAGTTGAELPPDEAQEVTQSTLPASGEESDPGLPGTNPNPAAVPSVPHTAPGDVLAEDNFYDTAALPVDGSGTATYALVSGLVRAKPGNGPIEAPDGKFLICPEGGFVLELPGGGVAVTTLESFRRAFVGSTR